MGMFFARSHPPAAGDERLRSLWLAVNTPELAADELPAGPARAAIGVHEEADGAFALCVLVRSLGDGALGCWSWDGVIEPDALQRAVDAALSFAEGMGFLFDDDALASADLEQRRRALDLWWELSGWNASAAEVRESPAAAANTAVPQTLAPVPFIPVRERSEGLPLAGAPEALPLTKFRRRLGAPPSEPPAERSEPSALGRLRLVKRARAEAKGDRPPFWLRLLGSF